MTTTMRASLFAVSFSMIAATSIAVHAQLPAKHVQVTSSVQSKAPTTQRVIYLEPVTIIGHRAV